MLLSMLSKRFSKALLTAAIQYIATFPYTIMQYVYGSSCLGDATVCRAAWSMMYDSGDGSILIIIFKEFGYKIYDTITIIK